MKQVVLLYLLVGLTNSCLSQTDFVTNKTILPKNLKENVVSIKAAHYANDTLTGEFEFLTANFDRENKLKKLTCHKKHIVEHYYLIEPSETKYIYKRHKKITKTFSPGERCEKNIECYKDTLLIKSKYLARGGLRWIRTRHEKGHFEWTREKHVYNYTFNQKINTSLKHDKKGR